jgi:hypothetical protein
MGLDRVQVSEAATLPLLRLRLRRRPPLLLLLLLLALVLALLLLLRISQVGSPASHIWNSAAMFTPSHFYPRKPTDSIPTPPSDHRK